VHYTSGAAILLDKKLFNATVKKGMDAQYDSYSGFQDDGGKKTDMDKILKKAGINWGCPPSLRWEFPPSGRVRSNTPAGFQLPAVLLQMSPRALGPRGFSGAIHRFFISSGRPRRSRIPDRRR
jgi:hypothetical protein